MIGRELDQVPEVAVQVREDGDAAIGLIGGRADPRHPGRGEARMVAREIVSGEKRRSEAIAG